MARYSNSNILTLFQLNKLKEITDGGKENQLECDDIALERFIYNLQLHDFINLSEEEKEERLKLIDSVDLFNVIQRINKELALVKVENYFIIDFLEKNDSKLLIGLKQRRSLAHSQSVTNVFGSITRSLTAAPRAEAVKSSSTGNFSPHSMSGVSKSVISLKFQSSYNLNYKTKAEMAEKLTNELENSIADLEAKGMHEIKLLKARAAEFQCTFNDTEEAIVNFELHFLRDERDQKFLETATERQLESKLRKYVNNWMKCARALLGTMRLRITTIQEMCEQHRADLITKADLSGILGAVDFEKLIIKRDQLLNSLEEKNAHMAGLKAVTGKASLRMSIEKQLLTSTEQDSRRINNKTVEVVKMLTKLEREASQVEDENDKDIRTLNVLKEQLQRYEAPSVNQYIEKKEDILVLEKEEKMLERKIFLANMKLNNILKKNKKKYEEAQIVAAL